MKKILSIRGTEVNDKMYDLTVSKEFVEEVTPENISDNIMNYLRINFEFNGDIINNDLITIRISNTRGKYWNTVFLRT